MKKNEAKKNLADSMVKCNDYIKTVMGIETIGVDIHPLDEEYIKAKVDECGDGIQFIEAFKDDDVVQLLYGWYMLSQNVIYWYNECHKLMGDKVYKVLDEIYNDYHVFIPFIREENMKFRCYTKNGGI